MHRVVLGSIMLVAAVGFAMINAAPSAMVCALTAGVFFGKVFGVLEMSDQDAYRAGKWVGICIAAARSASEFSSTWPAGADQKDADEIREWAQIHGMEVEFKDGFIDMRRPKPKEPPNLKVVN